MNLYGQYLPAVNLRFNRASKFAVDTRPMAGVRRFGPYDASLFPKTSIRCGIIYPKELTRDKELFVSGLVQGDGANYPGYHSLFRVNLQFNATDQCAIVSESSALLRQAALDLSAQNCDLVYILMTARNPDMYSVGKSVLLSNGIPCQNVLVNKLQTPQRPWILSNLALASYAKVGGTPWVVGGVTSSQELVMGISRAQDSDGKYYVGFVTLFNQEGDFLLLHSRSPVVEWSAYVDGLRRMLVEAYQEYLKHYGKPDSLVIHFHKRPGRKELEAIETALQELSIRIPYALVHLNEYSGFRLFDASNATYMPQTGLRVDLGQRRALLLLDGRENGARTRVGMPDIWEVSLDHRSTIDVSEFPRLLRQIQCFAKVNWRGFNAVAIPVTINYSKLICDLASEIGLGSWNTFVTEGKLREKAWFL